MPDLEDKTDEIVVETAIESDTIELVKKTYEDKILSLTADYEKKLVEKDAVIVQLVKGTTAEIQQSQEDILLDRLNKLKRR